MAFPLDRLIEQMYEGRHNVAKLGVAMILCGVILGSVGLSLIIFKAPGGLLLHLHGNTPVLVYYGTLTAVVAFGLVEASFGFWVVPRDQDDWRTFVGRMMLWSSIFALVLVIALGGSAFLK